ncbi:unnamed protein product [Cylicocyclus nassatus]|uniref:Uncharacterized protein n=1 Tax=Cylicocyclus nassatus TaxID=53992 RepID=A0AA36DNG8_CYLNA|nr:unnamed protein product [Cylicocyclus nassatus]
MKVFALILVVLLNLKAVWSIRLAILPPVLSQNSWSNIGFPNSLRFVDEVPRRNVREPRKNYPASFWFRG